MAGEAGAEGTGKSATAAFAIKSSLPPAAERQWRRAWTCTAAGAPLAGPPVALKDGWAAATANGRILAIDGRGAVRWTQAVSNIVVVGSPAVAGSNIVVAGSEGKVVALDGERGALVWQADTGAATLHGPLAIGSTGTWRVVLLSNSDGVLRCLDAGNGQAVWQSEATNRSDGPPASDGRLIAYGNCDSAVHVFDAATGKKKASVPVGSDAQMAGGVAILDRRIYGGTRTGFLVCADAEKERLAWQARISGGEAFVTPVASGDTVVTGTSDGTVLAFEASSGKERWRSSVSNAVETLAVVDNAVFVSAGGRIAGLRLADGARFASVAVGDKVEGPAVNGSMLTVGGDGGEIIGIAGEKPGKGTP